MISNLEVVYRRGGREVNEDAYVVDQGRGIFAVIDGATGLSGLSGKIASEILSHALQEDNGDILQRVLKGNSILGDKAVEAFQDPHIKSLEEIEKHLRSCCALAAIEIKKSSSSQRLLKMNYVAVADCMLFIQYHNGDIHQVSYDDIDYFDQKGLDLVNEFWKSLLAEGENPSEWEGFKIDEVMENIRALVNPALEQNRSRLNTSEGYSVIDGSLEVEDFLTVGTIPLNNVRKILLLTDGLKIHSYRNKKIENEWLYTARLAFEKGLAYLEKTILTIEEKDRACYDYPRYKQHDDKTGILIELG